jgi:hypothetical protein
VRFSVRQDLGRLTGTFWARHATGGAGRNGAAGWVERGAGGATVAAGTILEMAVPLADLGLTAGDTLTFFVALYDATGTELERHPEHRPIELTTPDAMFEGRNWHA